MAWRGKSGRGMLSSISRRARRGVCEGIGLVRFERVLLIQPAYPGSHYGKFHPPAGLGYVAESLRRAGIPYRVVDLGLDEDLGQVRRVFDEFRPDVLALSQMTYMYRHTYETLRRIRQTCGDVPVVVGGPHASTLREDLLRQVPEIAYAVTLEGDQALVELCRGDDVDGIRNLIHRRDGQVVYNGDRPFIEDLDAVHFPTFEGFRLEAYQFHDIDVVTSRGCPYSCIFCSVKHAIGRRIRYRTPAGVVDEIAYWHERGYRKFNFIDDNFTFDLDRAHAICDEIERRGFTDLSLTVPNGVRADRVNRDLLAHMRQVGFYYMAIGVEGGNDRVLACLKKGEKMETIRQAVRDATDLGYGVTLFFVVGTPGETMADIHDSARVAQEFPVIDARFNNLIPTPKSELYEWIEARGLWTVQPEEFLNTQTSWSDRPVFETPEFPYALRVKALRYLRRIRKRIQRRAVARKLGKAGFLVRPVLPLVVNDFTERVVMHNRPLSRIAAGILRAGKSN